MSNSLFNIFESSKILLGNTFNERLKRSRTPTPDSDWID
jgi:hypothetical protein